MGLTDQELKASRDAWNERLCDGDKTEENDVIWGEAWDAAGQFYAERVVPVEGVERVEACDVQVGDEVIADPYHRGVVCESKEEDIQEDRPGHWCLRLEGTPSFELDRDAIVLRVVPVSSEPTPFDDEGDVVLTAVPAREIVKGDEIMLSDLPRRVRDVQAHVPEGGDCSLRLDLGDGWYPYEDAQPVWRISSARPVVEASGEREAMEAVERREPLFVNVSLQAPTYRAGVKAGWEGHAAWASSRVPDEAAEIERLRDGLFKCAEAAGEDVSDGIPTFPDVVDWAVRAVTECRSDWESDEPASRVPSAPAPRSSVDLTRMHVIVGQASEGEAQAWIERLEGERDRALEALDREELESRRLASLVDSRPSSSAPEQVERIAKVIHADDCRQEGRGPDEFEPRWRLEGDSGREEYRSNARAVLVAVSGPPESDERLVTVVDAIGLIRELAEDLRNYYAPEKGLPPHIERVEQVCADLHNTFLAAGPPTKEER